MHSKKYVKLLNNSYAMNIDAFRMVPLNTGMAVRKADWIYTDVCSPFARIYYIVSGNATVMMGGQKYPLLTSHLYLIPPFVKHSTTCTGTFVHYYIHVYEDDASGIGVFDEYDFPVEVEALDFDRQLFDRLVELNPTLKLPFTDPKDYDNKEQLAQTITRNKQRSDWVKIESRGIVQLLFSRFLSRAKAKPFVNDARIVHSIGYIHDHLSERITVQQLADEADLSAGHFIRLFEQATGMSPKLFINMKRIERAQHLLHTTRQSVKSIASSLGYPDNSYFVRAFKNSLGMTPIEYRNLFLREFDAG